MKGAKLKSVILLFATLLLAGCVNLDPVTQRPATTTYWLSDAGHVTPAEKPDPRVLLLLDTTADAYYEDEAMAFSRAPGTLGRYQFARWSDWPSRRFQTLLRDRLRADGVFAAVARAGGVVRGDWLLDTRLDAFYHDASSDPGEAVIVLGAELVDLKDHHQIGTTRIEARAPAASYDAAGAAHAFDQAAGEALDRLTGWLAKQR